MRKLNERQWSHLKNGFAGMIVGIIFSYAMGWLPSVKVALIAIPNGIFMGIGLYMICDYLFEIGGGSE